MAAMKTEDLIHFPIFQERSLVGFHIVLDFDALNIYLLQL